jgi:hypothetical protein
VSVEETAPRTRRSLLAAGAGGLLAAVAATLGRPTAVQAANGDPVVLGTTNAATTVTTIQGPNPALAVTGGITASPASTGTTLNAVLASAPVGTAVRATTDSGKGLWAVSTTGSAVRVQTTSGIGVYVTTSSGKAFDGQTDTGPVAIRGGHTNSGTAIQGVSGAPRTPPVETGVQGVAAQSNDSVGVWGVSNVGTGVFGDTTNGYGVAGLGYYGVYGSGAAGVVGDVDGGTGVVGWTGVAFAPDPPVKVGVWAGAENGRTALDVHGVARFSRSGKVTFSAGQAS